MKQHTVFSSVGAEDLLGALRLVVNTTAGAANETEGRQDLLSGLAQLVGADVWVWTLQRLDAARLNPVLYMLIDGGWSSEEQRLAWLESGASPEIGPLLFALAPRVHRHVTLCRSDLMTGAEWYASPFYLKHREPVGLDDLLVSLFPVNDRVRSTLSLHRVAGRPLFGARERTIVHAMIGAVDWLHRIEPPALVPAPGAVLSRREREVLTQLVSGCSMKQIGSRLGLSEHTVRDYTKSIYRHYQVHSRGELLARFIPRAWPPPGEDRPHHRARRSARAHRSAPVSPVAKS